MLHIMLEGDRNNTKLEELRRQKLEPQNSWQQMKHAQLYSDVLKALER